MSKISKTDQVARQCRAVMALATSISEVHSDIEKIIVDGSASLILDQIGTRTAALMESLGDFLNGMDAVAPDDATLDDVFEVAHKMFPVEQK